ncbi:hypothetical protein [Bordetella sp. FB-8]|uniref:hypothetical protein n=1 Tax=Bordetella sp. FB-8 TaxID=1159870 RepID=UPI00036FFE9F|nr:hypothetical protein [Bordetella sp. FB-8]
MYEPSLACALLAATALVGAAPAMAEGQIAPLKPGQQMVLANYFELSGTGCSALSAPIITITQKPTLGTLTVARILGVVNTSSPQCAVRSKVLPISQVLYTANKPGLDYMSWSVTFQQRWGPHGKYPRMDYGNARLRINPGPPPPHQ